MYIYTCDIAAGYIYIVLFIFTMISELMNCVKVEVDVLDSRP